MTAYDQEGSTYSAKDINEERKAINDIYANKVVSLDEASLVTEPGFFCDALVINEINKSLTDKINTFKNINKNITKMIAGSKVVTAKASTSVQVFTNSEINKALGVTNPCIYYCVEDIQKLIAAAMGFVKYNTTYCNSLNVWISKETNAQTISEMYYGMEIPEEHQSEVLKNYIRIKTKDL